MKTKTKPKKALRTVTLKQLSPHEWDVTCGKYDFNVNFGAIETNIYAFNNRIKDAAAAYIDGVTFDNLNFGRAIELCINFDGGF